jgi:hypothetical protein
MMRLDMGTVEGGDSSHMVSGKKFLLRQNNVSRNIFLLNTVAHTSSKLAFAADTF